MGDGAFVIVLDGLNVRNKVLEGLDARVRTSRRLSMSIDRGRVPKDHAGLSSLALLSMLMLASSSNAKRI